MARVSVLPAQRKGKERERERGGGGGFRPGAAGSVRKDMSSMDEAVATRLGLGQLGKQLSTETRAKASLPALSSHAPDLALQGYQPNLPKLL